MKKIKMKCDICGWEKNVRADREFIEELLHAERVICFRSECGKSIPIKVDEGYIRVHHFFGDFWSLDRKATTEELQGVWRAKKILSKGKKLL